MQNTNTPPPCEETAHGQKHKEKSEHIQIKHRHTAQVHGTTNTKRTSRATQMNNMFLTEHIVTSQSTQPHHLHLVGDGIEELENSTLHLRNLTVLHSIHQGVLRHGVFLSFTVKQRAILNLLCVWNIHTNFAAPSSYLQR